MKEVRFPWSVSIQVLLNQLDTNETKGIEEGEALRRLETFGSNSLKVEKKSSKIQKFFSQFKSPVVLILIAAAVIAGALGELTDALAILVIVLINAFIGYLQETKAEAAIEALKDLSAPRAKVLRNGQLREVSSEEVVPGDILMLEAGDYVPADARIILGSQLSADEAVLTGESMPVAKHLDDLPESAMLAERKNMLFGSTAIATGSAKAIVTATGMNTEIGRIAGLLESAEVSKTPLQERLEVVSKKLLILCGAVVVLVAILGALHGEKWLDVLMTAIGLSVAAIPEGLPTVVTVALALAVRRMSKRNAIVRHLPAVETLGSTSVICTDKTGTLTTGKMRVRKILARANMEQSLIRSSLLCSNATLSQDGSSTGDPTEVALLHMGWEAGIDLEELLKSNPRLYEWSFDSIRKRMSVAVRSGERVIVHCKGAPESVLELCQLTVEEKAAVHKQIQSLSAEGSRLLAVATRDVENFDSAMFREWNSVERDLSYLGLVAIADPPREETIPAIKTCKESGIKIVMITGDHPVTAKAIGKELGIVEDGIFDGVMTGAELDALSADELSKRVENVAVYARVTPEHKLKIVDAWQKKGHVVAMTGDGVNDAPALKEASIGVSMGKGGTEVAKQASSMILTDDNFATIVSAVEEGRAIYGNIKRTIQYLLSGNLSEILIMLGAAIAGWPSPLAPIHLLWINLVTDGLPSLALAAEPVPKDILKGRAPSSRTFLDRHFYREMAFVGVITAAMALGVYGYMLKTTNELTARTYVFSFLVFAELFRSFACRSEDRTFFEMGLFSNVYHLIAVGIPIGFQLLLHHTDFFLEVFKVEHVDWKTCGAMILSTLIPVTLIEIRKLIRRRINK